MYRILLISVMLTGLFISCQKGSDKSNDLTDQLKLEQEETMMTRCFAFVYPLDVERRDGTIITINNDDQMHRLRESCDKDADYRRCFEFIYPISLTFKDGTLKEINSSEGMQRVFAWCKGENDLCYAMIYPITFIMPDGSTLTIEGEDHMGAIKRWYEAHPDYAARPVMQYPVEVKFKGEILTVTNDNQMKRIKEACSEGDKLCFKLVFPVTYTMPDGSTITIEGEDNMGAIKRWYEAHPDYNGRPVLQYPVEIKYRDGRIITIANENQMERAKAGCDQ